MGSGQQVDLRVKNGVEGIAEVNRVATLIQGKHNWNVYCILFAVAEFSILAAFLESKKRNYFQLINTFHCLSPGLG